MIEALNQIPRGGVLRALGVLAVQILPLRIHLLK